MTTDIADHLDGDGWYVELVRDETRTYSGPYSSRDLAARRAAIAHRVAPGVPTSVAVVERPRIAAQSPDRCWYLCGGRPDGIRSVSGPFATPEAAAAYGRAMRAAAPGMGVDGRLWVQRGPGGAASSSTDTATRRRPLRRVNDQI